MTTGFQLARECWALLRQNGEWMKIPLVSAVGVAVVTFVFALFGFIIFGPSFSTSNSQNATSPGGVLGVVFLFLYYLVMYSVVIYSETALVSVVLMKIRGEKENPVAADGFAVANKRLGAIVGFAALSATVGLIARGISQAGRDSKNVVVAILASLLASLIQGAWSLMTLMVTPVIVIENLGAFPALARSWELFKQTWGEQVVGRFSLGFFGCLLTLAAMAPGVLILALGAMAQSPLLLFGGGGVLLIGIVVVALLTNAVGGIFKAVMYQYVTTGNTGGILDEAQVKEAFAPAKA
jgi:hypothetical protein